jgi:mono/diheme cytochrome c family protein
MKLHPLSASLLLTLSGALQASAQPKQQVTVLDGVFTEAQAARGQERYEAICASCHEGAEPEANPPKGSEFIERWREAPVSFLYNFIRASMPGDKPGTLSEPTYTDLVAYLLHTSGYPTGAAELTAAKTQQILLVAPGGPKPMPANSLALAVGCLTSGADGEWMLQQGVAPVRVREGDQTTPEELVTSRSLPLGQASYKLLNAEDFPVAKLKDKKVQAKGVLTKVVNPYTLSVQSLEAAGDGCGK